MILIMRQPIINKMKFIQRRYGSNIGVSLWSYSPRIQHSRSISVYSHRKILKTTILSHPSITSNNDSTRGNSRAKFNDSDSPSLASKMLEAAATTLASILVLGSGFGIGGYLYHKFYKWLVLRKIDNAFRPGDPVLELSHIDKELSNDLAPSSKPNAEDHWILRDEQARISAIVSGAESGHYYLLIGEKGTGKSSMLLDAMRNVDGEGCSMLEAHADLEIFRVRLGKALDFEFHEDYIGSYFSERGPRDSTALLDIERAFNKLEKVALRRKNRGSSTLVLIIDCMHLLRDDDDGRNLLELLQQRAERWAANNLVTMVFNSDDYWIYERLKQESTRMEVIAITDLPKSQAISALAKYRLKYFPENVSHPILEEVFNRIGGRLIFLSRVARSPDMLQACDEIMDVERRWFLNQAWILGAEMDDDVMDQQKYAAAAMVLALALVKAEEQTSTSPEITCATLPEIPLHIAREIMTRCDFIQSFDHHNLFTITSTAMVRSDSVPMQRALRAICLMPGFEEHLQKTLKRIADIESLGRTREIVAKDLELGAKYQVLARPDSVSKGWEIRLEGPTDSHS
ncbi:BgTH12-02576 [Blumeria graminis f. sp. triticale]|nr:BgTH12-02576 [Blumeria graminis f. sp. triticale]